MTLVEREDQLSFLGDLFADCRAGNGRVVLVTGPIATGKTELLHTFARQAVAAGAVFLAATGSRAERALPLGVLGQLFRSAELPPHTAGHLSRLLDDAAFAAMLNDFEPDAVDQVSTPVLHRLCTALLDLVERSRSPLLIAVDDVHHADAPSLQCLSYLIRRLRSARVMVVLNETVRSQPVHSLFHAELPPEPQCHRIRLEPLSLAGTEAVLARHLDAVTARHLAPECHQLSGGNPLLLRGLVEDFRTAAKTEPATAVVGAATGQALLSCLYRCESTMLRLARGLAVLDEAATPSLLSRLLDLEPETTGRAIAALDAAGILTAGAFRHPASRAAVLDGMGREERAAMHSGAAVLLHEDGAPATAVARQLLAAEHTDSACGVPILHEAAEQALADGDLAHALDYLRLARQSAGDDRQRATTTAILARTEWRINPAMALRHVPELTAAVRDGLLTGRHALAPINWLLWSGHVDSALDTLRHVDRPPEPADPEAPDPEPADPETAAHVQATRFWLALAYPAADAGAPAVTPAAAATATAAATPAVVAPHMRAALTLRSILVNGPNDRTVADAEQILRARRVDEQTLPATAAALLALLHADRLAAAESWSEEFMAAAKARRAPMWHAVFAAVRAEASLRRGDLAAAESYARTALSAISPKSWGVAIGVPLSTLLQASTAMGKYEDAVSHLQMPVPDAMFRTPVGLYYLQARGRYHHATGHFHAALDDFQSIGALMAQWDLDLPALVPWRTDAAQTHLRLGRDRQARQLAAEQLNRLGPTHIRTRGVSLRVLAAASELQKRPGLLNQAVDALQGSGDRLHLAHALADLAWTHQALGRFSQARMILRRAHHLAKQCGAEGLVRTLLPEVARSEAGSEPGTGAGPGDGITELSDAEQRVAVLAARGYTNRQIANKLFVTVSTVEQHLTRVYRKLKVNRRTDLPLGLHPDLADPVSAGAGGAPAN